MQCMRGYIFSRPFMGSRVPQHIQNIVIKEYCANNGIQFLLSATEHTIPGCQMILDQVLDELSNTDGVVFYSIFQLPENDQKRGQLYTRMLKTKKIFHFVVERIQACSREDFTKIEQLWQLQKIVSLPQNRIDFNRLSLANRDTKC